MELYKLMLPAQRMVIFPWLKEQEVICRSENTQAVAGASIHFGLRTTSSADGTLQVNVACTADGDFSLVKGTGSHLQIGKYSSCRRREHSFRIKNHFVCGWNFTS